LALTDNELQGEMLMTELLITTVARAIIAEAEHLTALDQAIGDGDHGLNMKRGMEAVLAELPKLAGKPPGGPMRMRAVVIAIVASGVLSAAIVVPIMNAAGMEFMIIPLSLFSSDNFPPMARFAMM
jgi:dihydroxyacetone kinase